MRRLAVMTMGVGLLGCSPQATDSNDRTMTASTGSGTSGTSGTSGSSGEAMDCSVVARNAFVHDTMLDFYLWNDALPADLDVSAFDGPQQVLEHLTGFQPLDEFSFLSVIESENSFFGEGKYPGFGFGYAFEPASGEAPILFVHGDSPAARAMMARGQRIVSIDGVSVAELGDAGIGEALGPAQPGVLRTLVMRRADGSTLELNLEKDIVNIDPVPMWTTFEAAAGPVGYVQLSQFITPAQEELREAFIAFGDAGVRDVVLDLRYNGGGLVSTAEALGNLLGGSVAEGKVFSQTLFNELQAENNSVERFERDDASIELQRLAVIATGRTASASELIINALQPHVEVVVVGSTTLGKPVGQAGFDFCEQRLRPVTFEKVNAAGEGRYFDGIAPDCEAVDDLGVPIGSPEDPSLTTALAYLENGVCPPPPLEFAPPSARVLPDDHPFSGWK